MKCLIKYLILRVTCTLISLDVLTFANVPQVIEMVNYWFPQFLAFFGGLPVVSYPWTFRTHQIMKQNVNVEVQTAPTSGSSVQAMMPALNVIVWSD